MHVLRFGNKLNKEVCRGFIFANLFNSLYLLVRLWWNVLVTNLATNFQDLVAKEKNLVALVPVLGAISHPAKTSHQQSSTTCKTPHCCLFSQGADSYFWIFPYNTASFCTIDSHFCKMLWKPCTCLFNNTIVITLANCFSLELGLWDVVIIILGSRTPAQAYSSSWWEPVSKHT